MPMKYEPAKTLGEKAVQLKLDNVFQADHCNPYEQNDRDNGDQTLVPNAAVRQEANLFGVTTVSFKGVRLFR